MALFNIPTPVMPMEAFDKGFHTTDNLMNQILGRRTLKEHHEQFQQKQKMLENHFQQNFGMRKAAAARAAQTAMDAHRIAQEKLDPLSGIRHLEAMENYFKNKKTEPNAQSQYPDLQKMMQSQGNESLGLPVQNTVPQQNQAMGEQNLGMFNPQDLGQIQQRDMSNQPPQPTQPPQPNNPYGIDFDAIKKGLYQAAAYKAAGLKPPGNKESALTGAARDAESMEQLRKMHGVNSPVVKDAEAILHEKQQQHADLSAIRSRQLNGLKPGDTEIKNPETGQVEGFRKQTTEKQKEAAKNKVLFNEMAPLIFKVSDKLTGPGATETLHNAAKTYRTNPESKKLIDDALIAIKAGTNTTISEAARFTAGRTNQTYNRFAETLKSNDIPRKLEKWIREYEIPGEANKKAGERWIKILNEAEKKANKQIPATYDYYFDPDKQFAHQQQHNGNNESDLSPEKTKTKVIKGVTYYADGKGGWEHD